MSAENVIARQGPNLTISTHHKNGIVNERYLSDHERTVINDIHGYTYTDGVIAKYPSKDHWLNFTTQAQRDSWMDTWRALSPEDRATYIVGHHQSDALPALAERLGFDDVKEVYIGMCGSDQPVKAHHSDQFQARLQKIEDSMTESLTQKGVLAGFELDWQREKRLFEIGCGVKEEIARAQGYTDQPPLISDEWKTWYRNKETAICNFLLAA